MNLVYGHGATIYEALHHGPPARLLPMPNPKLCNPKPFKNQFRLDTKHRSERRYCFVLGAGASVASGIPSGKALAAQWLQELYERECSAPSTGALPLALGDWCKSGACPVAAINPENPGAHYPHLFLARYPGGDPEGQRFIQESIRGPKAGQPNVPSIGYAYLALILQQTESRVVITTNFDNLAADALLLFTGSLPRVVGHERVANFAGLRDGQPLIAKIHGDVGFVTTNDPDGVATLPREWTSPLREIFRDHIPIFIGYDGNDGSLMDFMTNGLFEDPQANEKRSLLRSGLYWCYRAGEGRDWPVRVQENPRLKKLAEAHQVHFVPIDTFDLWLMELGIAIGVGDPEVILRENTNRRIQLLSEQIGKARGEQAQPGVNPAVEASRAETRGEIGRKLKHWYLVYRARQEKDPEIADSLYQKAVAIAPSEVDVLGSYAIFLKNVRKDHARAEEFFERAVKADPNHANNLGNYANFLTNVLKDHARAEEFYERAVKADPNHANNLGNYASFLTDVRQDHARAEEFYERAVKADPSDANALGNLAGFLLAQGSEQRGLALLDAALNAATGESTALNVELEFYAFLHRAEERRGSELRNIRNLVLERNVRSPGWDFSANVQRATKCGHPHSAWLPKLAQVINGGAEPVELDGWEAWKNAG
jgi:Tfp pilus assembly protein PilF